MAYPTSAITFTTRNVGDTIQPAHVNDLQTEVAALEAALLGTLQHHVVLGAGKNLTVGGTTTLTGNVVSDLLFTDATYDIGKSGATRPRDGFFSRNVAIGGTLDVTGKLTLSATNNAVGTITSGVWNAGALTSSGTIAGVAGQFSGLLTVSGFGTHSFSAGGTGANIFKLANTTSGTAAEAYYELDAGTNSAYLEAFSQGYTTSGTAIASSTRLFAGGSGGLSLVAIDASGVIRLYSGGTTRTALFDTDRTVTMDVYGAGTATFSAAGKISSVSDERLKNITGPLGYGLAEVLALNPIRHTWNELSGLDDPKHTEYGGFSAQDVKAAMPLAVGVDARGYLTLSDRPILGATVNAIKSLHAVDVDHESRLRALEKRTQ